jgi:hypothetical protein
MRALTLAALSVLALALAPAGASALTVIQFQSPSRNIGCVLVDDTHWFVRCDIAHHSWPTPRKPPGFCRELDYGSGLQLAASGRASFVCAGDTTLGAGRILAYGRQISGGPLRCTSLTTGMRCVSRRSGHGFLLSRSSARPF